MNIVDVFIIIFILIGGFLGFKRGAVKEFVSAIGFFVITSVFTSFFASSTSSSFFSLSSFSSLSFICYILWEFTIF